MAAAKQASAEAKVRAAADAERRIEDSKTELARVKDQLASVLDYKQRKEILEEEVAKLNADMTKLRSDTAQQVLLGQLTLGIRRPGGSSVRHQPYFPFACSLCSASLQFLRGRARQCACQGT